MLRIGIDEAGLGPLLGPLVVAGCAFRTTRDGPGAAPFDADLRALLAGAVASPGARRASLSGGAVVVGDSKEVFGATHDPALLELPVLAFAAAASPDGRWPATLDALLDSVGAGAAVRAGAPWYGGAAPALPAFAAADHVARSAGLLRARLDEAGLGFLGFAADVVPESSLNEELARTPNKADVLFAHSSGVLDRLLARRVAGEGAGAALDRHGGRRFYLPVMSARWPGRFAWAVEETPETSRYRVALGDAEAEFRWCVGGDARHVEISLASMLAKYLRESFMGLWNGYFTALCPGVRGTAGYALDARRWLDESRAVRDAAGIPDGRLLRIR